jgi:hypothetical protein
MKVALLRHAGCFCHRMPTTVAKRAIRPSPESFASGSVSRERRLALPARLRRISSMAGDKADAGAQWATNHEEGHGFSSAPSRHAREKQAVLLAKAAYREFHVECFWNFESDVDITITKVDWVVEQLLRYGRGKAWKAAEEIKALLAG